MNSDEYHAINWDVDDSDFMTCRFCGLSFDDHERSCPYGIPDGWDDPVARGREEARAYREAL